MKHATSGVFVAGLMFAVALAGCPGDECEGPACATTTSNNGGICEDINACMATQTCPSPDTVKLDLESIASISTESSANPEIVALIPGEPNRAVLVSSSANKLSEVIYNRTSVSLGRSVRIETGSDTSSTTSIAVSPNGAFAAITVAEIDCGIGHVVFVDLQSSAAFGTVLGTVEVGYNPDSGAFSNDGKWFVSADEDDREDRPCKPADRFGGSATVIDLSGGPTKAVVAQKVPVDHALDSEPEGIAISPDGTVVVTIQETSELAFFHLADVPAAKLVLMPLPLGAEPDGIDISDDGGWAAVNLEAIDGIAIVDMAKKTLLDHYALVGSGDVPASFNRNTSGTAKVHAPEQIKFIHSSGAQFIVATLQESHSAIGYRISGDGKLAFDSITAVGINWKAEENGMVKSVIGPEGVVINEALGLGLTANEREGSVTLFATRAGRLQNCP
jgi:DNA-binding beta-propeller fold protein YncE